MYHPEKHTVPGSGGLGAHGSNPCTPRRLEGPWLHGFSLSGESSPEGQLGGCDLLVISCDKVPVKQVDPGREVQTPNQGKPGPTVRGPNPARGHSVVKDDATTPVASQGYYAGVVFFM